nr:hypothetical protein [Novosphingobium sp. KA1]
MPAAKLRYRASRGPAFFCGLLVNFGDMSVEHELAYANQPIRLAYRFASGTVQFDRVTARRERAPTLAPSHKTARMRIVERCGKASEIPRTQLLVLERPLAAGAGQCIALKVEVLVLGGYPGIADG